MMNRSPTRLYSYHEAVARGLFYQPRCLSPVIPGKSWAGALITDEDPADRWHRAQTIHRPRRVVRGACVWGGE